MSMTDREFLDTYAGNGERYPAFKFENVGDVIKGVLPERPRVVNVTNDGKEEKRLVVAVTKDDGETMSVWVKPGFSAQAIAEALKEAKVDGLAEGGTFAMQLVELKNVGKPSPAKVFKAKYVPPAPSGVGVDDLL
jgi:hypothetical protein